MNNLGSTEHRTKIVQYVRLNPFAPSKLPEESGMTCLDPVKVGMLSEQYLTEKVSWGMQDARRTEGTHMMITSAQAGKARLTN